MNSTTHWNDIHAMWERQNTAAVRAGEMQPAWQALADVVPLYGSLIDIGCSSGGFIQFLHDRPVLVDLRAAGQDVASFTGVDLSPIAVRLAAAAVPDGVFVEHDLRAGPLPFPDESFDTVFSGHVIEHMADPLILLHEMRRLVKPSGYVIVEFPYEDPPYPEHIHQMLTYDTVGAWIAAADLIEIERRPVVQMNPTNDGVIIAARR